MLLDSGKAHVENEFFRFINVYQIATRKCSWEISFFLVTLMWIHSDKYYPINGGGVANWKRQRRDYDLIQSLIDGLLLDWSSIDERIN